MSRPLRWQSSRRHRAARRAWACRSLNSLQVLPVRRASFVPVAWGDHTTTFDVAPISQASAGRLTGAALYRVPEIVTLGRLPGEGESDSRWRTKEVRHVGSDTLTPGFRCVAAAQFGQENQRRSSGPAAFGACGDL